MGLSTKLAAGMVGAGLVFAGFSGEAALGFPVRSGGNNLVGVGAGLTENYVRDATNPDEYLSPFEVANGIDPGPGPMPGHDVSIRVDGGGNVVGLNMAQPGLVNTSDDARGGFTNPLTGGSFWGARSGVAVELSARRARRVRRWPCARFGGG